MEIGPTSPEEMTTGLDTYQAGVQKQVTDWQMT